MTTVGNVSVDLDFGRVEDNLERAQLWLGNEVLKDCNPYVPKLNEVLVRSGRVENGGSAVSWNTPYARYQYYGKLMVGPAPKELTDIDLVQHHPGTCAFWFEAAKSANSEKWIRGVKKIGGGQ